MCLSTSLFAIFSWSGGELLIVLFIILLLFGGTKLPSLARGLGQSVNEGDLDGGLGDGAHAAGSRKRSRRACSLGLSRSQTAHEGGSSLAVVITTVASSPGPSRALIAS